MKNINKHIKRTEQLKAGAYDGRFKSKIVADKKKKENKNFCRQNKNFSD